MFLFFMHLLHSPKLVWLVAGGTFVWLAIMFALTLTDYMSRGLKTYPGGAGGAGYGVRSAAPAHEAPASGEHKEGAAETAH